MPGTDARPFVVFDGSQARSVTTASRALIAQAVSLASSATASCSVQPTVGSWASQRYHRSSRGERPEFVGRRRASRRPGRRAWRAATMHRIVLPQRHAGDRGRHRWRRPRRSRRVPSPGRVRRSVRAAPRAHRSRRPTSPSTHDTSRWPFELTSHGSTNWRTASSTSSSSRSTSSVSMSVQSPSRHAAVSMSGIGNSAPTSE